MKKRQRKMAWLLAASMMISMMPAFMSAQAASTPTGVVIKGRYDTSVPVRVEYQCDAAVTIQWQSSATGTDGWSNISGATSATYTPLRGMALKWIRAGVTANGSTVYSEPKKINDRWYGKKSGPADGSTAPLAADANVTITTINASGALSTSSTKDIFTIDGDEYILLDTTEDDNSHYLVMRKRAIGNHTTSVGAQLFNEILCWLNDMKNIAVYSDNVLKNTNAGIADYSPVSQGGIGGYRSELISPDTTYEAISDKIMKYVDENAVWKQEPKMWDWGNSEITYVCGLAIPSLTEYEKYKSKIGWKDFRISTDAHILKKMALRTGNGNVSGSVGHGTLEYNTDWALGTTYQNSAPSTTATAIRPIFYLKKDFFLDEDIVPFMNFNQIGENVKLAIVSNYSYNELLEAGYNESDIEPYDNRTGFLSEVVSDGLYETSLPITLNYTYEGNEKRLKFTLYASNSENGTFTEVSNQTGNKKYTLPVSTAGKYVKFSVETTDGIIKWTQPHLVGLPWGWEVGIHPENIGKESTCSDGSKIIMKDLDVKNRTTPVEYLFTVGDMDFIMLDVTNSNASKFFVMSKNIVSGEAFNYPDGGQLMDSMMNFLNSTNGVNGYLPKGTYQGRTNSGGELIDVMLPQDILNHINFDQTWKVERKMWDDATERAVTGGLSLPAMHEIRQYSHKIGLWDDQVSWWTRTPYGGSGSGATMLCASGTTFGAFFSELRQERFAHFRPVFYLDRSMFTDQVFDLSKFGIEALAAVRETYTRNELLAAGYSEEMLQNYYDVSGELLSAEINAIYETSLPAKVKFDYTGNNLTNIKINWYLSNSINGEYTLSGSVTGDKNNYRIPYSAGGKYIKAEVICIPTGTSFWTEARYIEPAWGPQAAINNATIPNDDGLLEYKVNDNVVETYPYNPIKTRMPATTPRQYTFTYNDVEYILLDTTESDESHYLVMVKKPVARHVFNKANNGGQVFDDLIGWLNGVDQVVSYVEGKEVVTDVDYAGNGFVDSANKLPAAISAHINWQNNWKTERKMWTDVHERVYVGGIAIPAYKELERYAEKIGSYDAGAINMWLRTPDGRRGGDGNSVLASGTASEFAGYFYSMSITNENYIRPIFYLDKNFFTSVRVENIGVETAALISADVPKATMIASGLYNAEEIAAMYPVEPDYIRAKFSNVTTGGEVTATFSTNMGVDGSQWVFIAAVYDENGKMLGMNFVTQEVFLDAITGIYSINVTVPNIPAGSGNYAKGFVWDYGIEYMYPNTPAL